MELVLWSQEAAVGAKASPIFRWCRGAEQRGRRGVRGSLEIVGFVTAGHSSLIHVM
jgi:hypothetical protein